jgi:hypothetical protein
MIDESFSNNIELFKITAQKLAYGRALFLFTVHPFEQAKRLLQEHMDKCEDMEMSIERKLETTSELIPIHSSIL